LSQDLSMVNAFGYTSSRQAGPASFLTTFCSCVFLYFRSFVFLSDMGFWNLQISQSRNTRETGPALEESIGQPGDPTLSDKRVLATPP